jgi:hypothetical protein
MGSARYGKAYDENQIFDRVSKGFFTAGCLYSQHHNAGDRIALAFPDAVLFRKYLTRVKPALGALGIDVYIVHTNSLTVTVNDY